MKIKSLFATAVIAAFVLVSGPLRSLAGLVGLTAQYSPAHRELYVTLTCEPGAALSIGDFSIRGASVKAPDAFYAKNDLEYVLGFNGGLNAGAYIINVSNEGVLIASGAFNAAADNPEPTVQPTPAPTPSEAPTPQATPTAAPSAAQTPQATPTATTSATATPQATPTPAPSATATPQALTNPQATPTPQPTAPPTPQPTAALTASTATATPAPAFGKTRVNAGDGPLVASSNGYLPLITGQAEDKDYESFSQNITIDTNAGMQLSSILDLSLPQGYTGAGPYQIIIPMPGYDGAEIYHYTGGRWVNCDANYQDGNIIFSTTGFSPYAIVVKHSAAIQAGAANGATETAIRPAAMYNAPAPGAGAANRAYTLQQPAETGDVYEIQSDRTYTVIPVGAAQAETVVKTTVMSPSTGQPDTAPPWAILIPAAGIIVAAIVFKKFIKI